MILEKILTTINRTNTIPDPSQVSMDRPASIWIRELNPKKMQRRELVIDSVKLLSPKPLMFHFQRLTLPISLTRIRLETRSSNGGPEETQPITTMWNLKMRETMTKTKIGRKWRPSTRPPWTSSPKKRWSFKTPTNKIRISWR